MILWIKSYDVTIQMKAVEHYVPLLLFIMLYNCGSNQDLTFESVDEFYSVIIQWKRLGNAFTRSFRSIHNHTKDAVEPLLKTPLSTP